MPTRCTKNPSHDATEITMISKPKFALIGQPMRRAALYLWVSTNEQTTENQARELRAVASRMGCEVTKVYSDQGISGAKGRDKRPAFDQLCRDATQRRLTL